MAHILLLHDHLHTGEMGPSTAPLQVALLMRQPDTSQQILKPQGPSISQEQLASFPA